MVGERQKNTPVAPRKRVVAAPGSASISATLTLAFWQLRLIWRLLLLECAGAIAAIMLVCAIPLYAQVGSAVNLHRTLSNFLPYSTLTFAGEAQQISPSAIQQSTQRITQLLQQEIGTTLPTQPQLSLQSAGLALAQPFLPSLKDADIRLISYDLNQPMTTHLTIEQGRLPGQNGNTLEIALTPQVANELHAAIDTIIPVTVAFADTSSAQLVASDTLPLRVVGLFTPKTSDSFWHGETFARSDAGPGVYDVLSSNGEVLSTLARATQQALTISQTAALDSTFHLYWYCPLNPARLVITQTDPFLNGLRNLIRQAPGAAVSPAVLNIQVEGALNQLEQYDASSQVLLLPMTVLAVLVLALLTFFISLMAELLVERQTTAIALLHSRGASDGQIFGAMATQSVLLGLLALALGPLLALLLILFLARSTLPLDEQSVLALTPQQALAAVLALRWYALPAVGAAVISMILTINRSVNANLLLLRREQTRATRRPLWQRLYLDIIAALIALIAFGISISIVRSGLLDTQSQVLIAAPLSQIAPLFFLLACLLLFLRLFPLMLHLGSWFSMKARGAASMLAMTRVTRMPGQSLRLTLLLTLSIAFLLFCQILSSSQAQRVVDVATFQAGADFRGTIQTPAQVQRNGSLAEYVAHRLSAQEASYARLSGVQAASAGYRAALSTLANGGQYTLLAIDPTTFAQVAAWSAQDSAQPLPVLLRQLVASRSKALSQNLVPAIVDNALWNQLQLSSDEQFTLDENGININFVALERVQSIPTIFDSAQADQSGNGVVDGGLLVDYESYAVNVINDYPLPTSQVLDPTTLAPATSLWLKTSDDPTQLAALRAVLTGGALRLAPLYDRRAIIARLQQDFTQRNLIDIIALGSLVPLLLALLGNLLATWLDVRNRLTGFTVLRALGCAPRQLAAVLGIELGIVYTTALLLGLALGLLFARLTVPTLIFTTLLENASNTGDIFLAQNVPAVRVIVPTSLLALLGLFLLVCLAVLATMILVASRPKMSQALRINED